MAATGITTLYSPTGDKYQTSDLSETTRLKSRGYTEKRPTPTQIKVATGEAAPKS